MVDTNPTKLKKENQNGYKKFVSNAHCISDGKITEKEIFNADAEIIEEKGTFDDFYTVYASLEGNTSKIIEVDKRRLKI